MLYCGHWRSPFQFFGPLFVSLPGVSLFPWQVLLIMTAPLCLLAPGAFRKRSWILDAAIATSFLSVAVTFLWGWMRGGSAYQAYYQLWRFIAALTIALLLHSVVRKSRDLKALGATVLLAALVRGTLATYFYWMVVRGKIDPPPLYMTTHDDSLLFVCGVIIAVSWAIAKGGRTTWFLTVLVSGHLLYAMILNNRRLVWVELVLSLVVMAVLLPRGAKRRLRFWVPLVAPLVLGYVVVGWGREGAFFAPVQALSTAGSNQDASSLARQEEIRNLLHTLTAAGNPILGTGWLLAAVVFAAGLAASDRAGRASVSGFERAMGHPAPAIHSGRPSSASILRTRTRSRARRPGIVARSPGRLPPPTCRRSMAGITARISDRCSRSCPPRTG
jgi:hypothetical protein